MQLKALKNLKMKLSQCANPLLSKTWWKLPGKKKLHHEILIFGYISPQLLIKQEVREWEFLVVWDVSWWRWDRVDCDLLHIYLSNKQATLLRLNLYSIHMFKWIYPLRRYGEEGGGFLFCSTLSMFMCGPKLDILIWALTQFWSPPQLFFLSLLA